MIQGSDEWKAARAGKVTASRMADVLARGRNGEEAAGRRNYRAQLVAERLSGLPQEGYVSAAMQWGIDTEPMARALYEVRQGVDVAQAGFTDHPVIPMAGASPDGLVGSDGMIEIKCPETATHIDTVLSGMIPPKYIVQMQWQMACEERAWNDFVSFDPRLPEGLDMVVIRLLRDGSRTEEMEQAAKAFLLEVEDMCKKLLERKAGC